MTSHGLVYRLYIKQTRTIRVNYFRNFTGKNYIYKFHLDCDYRKNKDTYGRKHQTIT